MADRSIKVLISASVTGLVNSLKTADKATQDWGNKTLAAIAKNEQSINTLSNGLGVIGAGLTGLATLAVKKFADFDAAMSSVAATGDDARGSIDALREAAIQAGADTQYSATEAAGAIEELAKAGVSAADILGGGLDGALSLAAAGQMDVAEAAEYASIAMTQFKLSGDDVNHVADLLAAGAGKAMGEVSDLGQALKQGGLVASQTGLSIEETTGALSAFASAGLLGSDAGTSLKTMLQRLTPQSKEAQAQFDALGISAYDANGNFVGLTNFAGQLQEKMKDLTPEARNAALSVMFGSDAVRAASVLYDQGAQGIQGWIDAVDDQGYAAEVAATKMDNLKGDLEQLSGSFETALIGMGEGANGPLRSLVQALDDLVDRFNGLSDGAKQATLLIVGGGGLVMLGVAGLGKMAVATAEAVTAMRNLGIVSEVASGRIAGLAGNMAKFVAAGAAVTATFAATGAAADALSDKIAGPGPAVDELTDSLYRLSRSGDLSELDAQFSGISASMGALGVLTSNIDSLGDAMQHTFQPGITDHIVGFFDGIPGFTSYLEKAEERFSGVDASLASMVQSGHIDQARAAFEALRVEGEAHGATLEDIRAQNPLYVAALDESKKAAQESADAQEEMRVSTSDTTYTVEDQVAALKELIDAQSTLAGNVLSVREAQRGLEEATAAVTESIKENGTSLDITTEKGRANQSALDGIASAGWDLIESMTQNGATQEELQATMADTRQRFIDAASQFGLTGDEANALADQLKLIPSNVNVTAQYTDNASEQIQAFINRWANTTVTVKAIMEASPNLTQAQAADAARYTGQAKAYYAGRNAGGGLIRGPGSGTSDSILAHVSNGEFVTKASATAKHRPLLEAINNDALPAFASGGYVARQYVAPTYITQMSSAATAGPASVSMFEGANVTVADPYEFTREVRSEMRLTFTGVPG